jgi:excisionase family DNA binding protein
MNTSNISTQLQEIKALLTQQSEKPMCFSDAAEYLNISKSYLYKLTCKNGIPYYKPNGKKIYFSKSELDKWIMRNPVKSDEQIEEEAQKFVSKLS